LEVREVMDQRMAPGYLCFKVKAADRTYLLKYYQAQDVWEVELVRSPAVSPADGEN